MAPGHACWTLKLYSISLHSTVCVRRYACVGMPGVFQVELALWHQDVPVGYQNAPLQSRHWFIVPPLVASSVCGTPGVFQVELHPLWRQESLLQYCQSKGIHVSAHTPLGIPARYALDIVSAEHEALLNSWSKAVPAGKGKSKSVLAPMLRHTVVQQLAAKYSKTPAQVGLLVYPFSVLVTLVTVLVQYLWSVVTTVLWYCCDYSGTVLTIVVLSQVFQYCCEHSGTKVTIVVLL